MKKVFATLFLAVALVVPVFAADDTDLELIPKIGYLFSPEITADSNSTSKESAISLGVDLFFDMQNNFFLGAGLVWGQNHKEDDISDKKVGFTNAYAALKYKFLVNASEDDPFYIYPLAQIGFGMPGWDVSGYFSDYKIDGGFYWGLGIGGEIKNIIVEFIYGCNYATEKYSFDHHDFSQDFTYTAFRINVGYKFIL